MASLIAASSTSEPVRKQFEKSIIDACKPASHVELHIKQYIQHSRGKKDREFRVAILEGMKAEKTNRKIAKELGMNEKTIAKRRRAIERELLEAAL